MRAYLALPAVGRGPWPGVVVIHDAFGLTTLARTHADRLSAAGYLALVPDLYARGGLVRCVGATIAALTTGRGLAYQDLDAARGWLQARDDCTGRIGVSRATLSISATPTTGRCRETWRRWMGPAQSSRAMGRKTVASEERRRDWRSPSPSGASSTT